MSLHWDGWVGGRRRDAWQGVAARPPAETPAEVVDRLNARLSAEGRLIRIAEKQFLLPPDVEARPRPGSAPTVLNLRVLVCTQSLIVRQL